MVSSISHVDLRGCTFLSRRGGGSLSAEVLGPGSATLPEGFPRPFLRAVDVICSTTPRQKH